MTWLLLGGIAFGFVVGALAGYTAAILEEREHHRD